MNLQSSFEIFPGVPTAGGFPIPQLDAVLGRKFLEGAKLLVNPLRGFATEAVCAADPTPEFEPKAIYVGAIEEIGRQLYDDSGSKYIWPALQATDGSELEGAVLAEQRSKSTTHAGSIEGPRTDERLSVARRIPCWTLCSNPHMKRDRHLPWVTERAAGGIGVRSGTAFATDL